MPRWAVALAAIAGLSIGLSLGIALSSGDDADESSVLLASGSAPSTRVTRQGGDGG